MNDIRFTRSHMELLINLVRENPGLYDQSLPKYKDQLWTNNCWKKLAKRFTDTEGITGEILRKKWKNKRDSYKKNKKAVRTKKSGSGAGKIKKIEFFDVLTFLDSHIADKSTTCNVPEQQRDPLGSDRESDVQADEDSDSSNPSPSPSASEDEMSEAENLESAPSATPKRKNSSQAMSSGAPSPSSSVSSAKKKKRGAVDKIDELIFKVSKNMSENDMDIEKIQKTINSKESVDEFYVMISHRLSKMSKRTQSWMEEQVWNLYMQAKRMERMEQGACPTAAMPCVPSNGNMQQDYAYMQPTQPQQQPDASAGYAAPTRSAFSFIQNSLM